MAQKQIKWKFNPPGAPHFGGVWERMVRSCKKAMIAIVGNRTLTDDVLSTAMCLVEQILNSRPLTSVSDNPKDLEALSPNHFLLGRSSPATPFIPDAQRYTDLRRVFRVSQAYADMIWSRWNREYLPRKTGPAMSAPVISRQRNSIQNMLVEKQELKHFIT